MRITILHSTLPENASLDEQETLLQVATVENALEKLGHTVSRFAFNVDFQHLLSGLRSQQPDIVFNLVESINGKGDKIYLPPLLLEQLAIPYTGANSQSILLTTDKLLAKQWMSAGRLPTPKWFIADEMMSPVFPDDGPYIVKPVDEDGSIGIEQDSVVFDQAGLQAILHERKQRFGGRWFVEKFIAGREFNVSLLAQQEQIQVLNIAEIRFHQFPDDMIKIVDYAAKWHPESQNYHIAEGHFEFTDKDQALLAELARVSVEAWRWFNVSGFARVDLRVDEEGNIYILEVNANPSLAKDAGFSEAALHTGLRYEDIIQRLLDNASVKSNRRVEVC